MPSPIGPIVIKFLADTKELGSGLSRASSLIRDWSLVVTGLTQGISNAFRIIAEVGIKAVTVSLAGLTAAFLITAKSGADFEDNMVRTFAILQESAGATQRDLAALTEEARRLGRDTLASGTQAAEGMMVLARAGFDVKEIMTATQSVIDLSIVGNMSVAESATAAASAMRGFGLEATDLAKVNDVLAKASSLANTDIRLLSSALSFVAPLSRAAGISIEETATAIDILSNAGIRGSRAGTTLRRMLSVLLAPTGRAKKAFNEMNLTFVDSEGKIDSLSSVLRKLESAGLNAAETMEIFGLRAGPGVAALLGAGSAAFDKLKGQIEDSEGAADRMSQAFRTSVKGRVLDLSASIKDLGLAFSEEFKKPLADTIFAIRNWLVNLVEALEKTKFFKAIIKGLGEVLSPIISKIKEMASSFADFLTALTPEIIAKFFDSIRDKITNFINSLEEDKQNIIDFFEAAIAPALFLIKLVVSLVKSFLGLPAPLQKAITLIVGLSTGILILAGGIVPLISLVVLLGLAFGPTRVAFFNLISLMFRGTPIIAGVGVASASASAGVTALGGAFGLLLKRLFIISIIIIGVISLIKILKGVFSATQGEGFMKGFNESILKLPGALDNSLDEMKTKVSEKNIFGDLTAQLRAQMKLQVESGNFGKGFGKGMLPKGLSQRESIIEAREKRKRRREEAEDRIKAFRKRNEESGIFDARKLSQDAQILKRARTGGFADVPAITKPGTLDNAKNFLRAMARIQERLSGIGRNRAIQQLVKDFDGLQRPEALEQLRGNLKTVIGDNKFGPGSNLLFNFPTGEELIRAGILSISDIITPPKEEDKSEKGISNLSANALRLGKTLEETAELLRPKTSEQMVEEAGEKLKEVEGIFSGLNVELKSSIATERALRQVKDGIFDIDRFGDIDPTTS